MEKFFAVCPRGLEEPLQFELNSLNAKNIKKDKGGVHFEGNFELCYDINLKSRVASRVLWKILEKKYKTEQNLYNFVYNLDWNSFFDVDKSIRIDTVGRNCPLRSLNFATLKIKDAICDKFRTQTTKRPSVNRQNPGMRIHVFLGEEDFILSLDTSGEPLFKRGIRQHTNEAPLRENLAAGILYLSGWKPGVPILDPMCGSGTFLIEAAQMALNIAPGISRDFAFQKMKNFNSKYWDKLWNNAILAEKDVEKENLQIFGSDIDKNALKTAKLNLEETGLIDVVSLKQADFSTLKAPTDNGIIVANLPYGERLGNIDELRKLYPKIGDVLKQNFTNWNAFLLTSDFLIRKYIRLTASKKIPLFNGAIECRLFEYKIVKGSHRKLKES